MEDGRPAYASEFSVYIVGNRFYLEPKTIYPAHKRGQKITYTIEKQKLILNSSDFKPDDVLMGYIDAEFVEKTDIPGKPVYSNKLYIKGSFRTEIK